MRTQRLLHRYVLLGLVVSVSSACEVGDGDFDGSVFDEDAAAADGGKDAGDDDDGGSTPADGGSQDASTGIAAADVPAALAHAACGALSACRGDALLTDYLRGEDCDTLYENRQEDSALRYLSDSIEAGRVVFHPARVEACTDALAALACDVQTYRLPSVCEQAFVGKVALDGDCDIDFDCAGSAYCAKATEDTCPGTCSEPQSAGLPCERSAECEDGLVCYQPDSTMPGTCAAPGADGDDCATGMIPCGIGFVCRTEGSARVCRSLETVYVGDEGDGCAVSGLLCSDGLVCASTTATDGSCETKVASDAPCRRAQPSQCPRDQYCDAQNPGDLGNCVDFPAADEPCLTGRSQVCAAQHVCVSDTCKPMRRAAESCETDAECYSGTCLDVGGSSICVAPSMCTQL